MDDTAVAPIPSRRAFLKSGLLAAAGAAGWGAAAITSGGPPATAAKKGTGSLRLHGARWRLGGAGPPEPGRLAAHGELLASNGGAGVGTFSSTRLAVPSSAGAEATGAEFHVFELEDGSIFGMGTPPARGGSAASYAIMGGTGRYAGAAGHYVADQRPIDSGGDGTAEFNFTFTH